MMYVTIQKLGVDVFIDDWYEAELIVDLHVHRSLCNIMFVIWSPGLDDT